MTTMTYLFTVSGMHCASCSLLIDETVEELPGVQSSHTSLRSGVATVRLDTGVVTPAEVAAAISSTGYPATWKQE